MPLSSEICGHLVTLSNNVCTVNSTIFPIGTVHSCDRASGICNGGSKCDECAACLLEAWKNVVYGISSERLAVAYHQRNGPLDAYLVRSVSIVRFLFSRLMADRSSNTDPIWKRQSRCRSTTLVLPIIPSRKPDSRRAGDKMIES